MVATIAALKSAAQAGSYYAADDSYYAESGKAPSLWAGRAAAALGLAGPVDLGQFQSLLEGRLPNGQTLGTKRSDALEHRPGWDITLSAPKSVSVMALVAGDERLIGAHERAVAVALDFVERHGAATRIRGEDGVERVQTSELMVATFRHETSRAHDPQLHTHSVVMNATRDAEGNGEAWSRERSIFFRNRSVRSTVRNSPPRPSV